MSEVKIGEFSGQPLVAGACTLCGNEGTGNMGLFLCKSHIAVIIKEHGEGLNKRWHKEFRATLLSTIRERVEREIDYFCEVMHITYETAAIEEGWRTQEITRGEWENSPESNKATMRKSVRAVLLSLLTEIEGEMK